MLYLKARNISPGGSSNQKANSNLTEQDKIQEDIDGREYLSKKLDLPQTIDIIVAHHYSRLIEKNVASD